jgi:hypothetical protein
LRIFLSGYKTYTANTVPKDFYQFALNASSVKQDFEVAGFKCLYSGQRGGLLGLKRLWPAIAPMEELLSSEAKKQRRSGISRSCIWAYVPYCPRYVGMGD